MFAGPILGLLMAYKIFNEPTKIEFEIFWGNWVITVLVGFSLITAVIPLEMLLCYSFVQAFPPQTPIYYLLLEFLKAGVLVPLFCCIISCVFEWMVEKFDLDLHALYNGKILKAFFSWVVLLNCIGYLVFVWPQLMSGSVEIDYLVNRLIMWTLTVVGTWVGIGFHASGRITQEIRNREESKKVIDRVDVIKYLMPFVASMIVLTLLFIVFALLYRIGVDEEIVLWLFIFMWLFISGFGISAFLCICHFCPSEKRSNKKLSRAMKMIHRRTCVTRYYENVKYALKSENDQKYLNIYSRDVLCEGNEKEVHELFDKQCIEFDEFDYDEIKKLLHDLHKRRGEFIHRESENCRENVIKQLQDGQGAN